MKMKKIIALMLTLIVAFAFVACGDDKPEKEDYVGAWKCVAIILPEQSYPEDFDLAVKDMKKFKKDMKKTNPDSEGLTLNYLFLKDEETSIFFLLDEQYTGTWELADDSILFYQDDASDYSREFKIDFENNRLIYELENGSKWIYEKEEKK